MYFSNKPICVWARSTLIVAGHHSTPLARDTFNVDYRMIQLGMDSSKRFTIRQDPTRARKGLKSWAVFEEVSSDFSRGVSQHYTLEEAITAKVLLEKEGASK